MGNNNTESNFQPSFRNTVEIVWLLQFDCVMMMSPHHTIPDIGYGFPEQYTYVHTYVRIVPRPSHTPHFVSPHPKAMATGGADLLNTVVIGATGATGKCLVGSLLKTKVLVLG